MPYALLRVSYQYGGRDCPYYHLDELPDTLIRSLKAMNRQISGQDAHEYSARANEVRKDELEKEDEMRNAHRYPKTKSKFTPLTCHTDLLYCVPVRIVLDCIEAAGWQVSLMTSTSGRYTVDSL